VILPAKISIAASGPLYWSFSYRRCPLASKTGNLKEEIKDQKTGILVPNSNWSQAFDYAIKNQKTITKIEKNIDIVAKARSPLATAIKYANVYKSV
jgi:glycosyltransferase involved in cell wall biosynthesis